MRYNVTDVRTFNKQNGERHGSFCFPLSWVVCQVACVSYRTARVPNDMHALSLVCNFDTHTWEKDEREIKVIVTRVVFVRFVQSIVKIKFLCPFFDLILKNRLN